MIYVKVIFDNSDEYCVTKMQKSPFSDQFNRTTRAVCDDMDRSIAKATILKLEIESDSVKVKSLVLNIGILVSEIEAAKILRTSFPNKPGAKTCEIVMTP